MIFHDLSFLPWRACQVQDSLEGVEHRFRETAHKAVRIGDRLSKMEGQRARAAEAMELLEIFKVCMSPAVYSVADSFFFTFWNHGTKG